MKIDIHNHILPETWPDLKEVTHLNRYQINNRIPSNGSSNLYLKFEEHCVNNRLLNYSVTDMAVGFNWIMFRVKRKVRLICLKMENSFEL